MIEEFARVAARDVSRETIEKLDAYAALLREESRRQNLVSASTLEHLWERHIRDSAQLVRFEPRPGASWVDIGSGAGLPGIVVACMVSGRVTLVEPRRLRADFLHKCCESLCLNARVLQSKVEQVTGNFEVITARAVAPLPKLLDISHHLSTDKSVWVLPKGRGAQAELAEAKRTWQGAFHVEHSVTDADSLILVATGVRAKHR
jgi:16S rRNA (guanine527-N7)-methyltransferase